MKILCNLSEQQHKNKPTSPIQNELRTPAEHDLKELCSKLSDGYSIKPAGIRCSWDIGKGKYNYNFISQQLFICDIDNSEQNNDKTPFSSEYIMTPEKAVNVAISKGLKPCYIYYSYSSKPKLPKFHVCFVFDKAITDKVIRDSIHNFLIDLFGMTPDRKNYYSDHQTKSYNNIFYGSYNKPSSYSDFTAINSLETVIELSKDYIPAEIQHEQKERKVTRTPATAGTNIRLIQEHNVEELRTRLGIKESKQFDSKADFLNYIKTEINLADLLELPEEQNFPCLFHNDKKASATIYKSDTSKVWLYNCFACDSKNLNIQRVIEKLGNFSSQYQATKFIQQVYCLEVKETEEVIQARADIDSILELLTSTDSDKEQLIDIAPITNKVIKKDKDFYIKLLLYIRNHITPEQMDTSGNYIIYLSNRQIQQIVDSKSLDKTNKKLQKLQYLLMIVHPKEEQIPKAILQKVDRGYKNHTSLYFVPSWTANHIHDIELQSIEWKEQGYTLQGMSTELLIRSAGTEKAKEVFTQEQDFKTFDKWHDQILRTVQQLIQQKGYATEQEIINCCGLKKCIAIRQIKRSLADIMNCNCLIKVKNNKKWQEELGTDNKRYYIIVPDDSRVNTIQQYITEQIQLNGYCKVSDLYKLDNIRNTTRNSIIKMIDSLCVRNGYVKHKEQNMKGKPYILTLKD